jgi:hypothetical protein
MSNANMSVGSTSAMPMGMDNALESIGSEGKSGGANSQLQSMLGKLMDGAFADGTFDKNDLAAMQALIGGGSAPQTQTAQAAAPKDNLSSFIDKAVKDGKIDDNEQAGINALLDAKNGKQSSAAGGAKDGAATGGAKEATASGGGKESSKAAGGSEASTGKATDDAKASKKDTAGDAKFLSEVNELSRSGDEEGGKMLREQANRLLAGGGSAEDKKAFLDEANKLKGNDKKDGFLGIGNYGGSINEAKDNEGTMMKDLTTALLRGKEGQGADGKSDAKSGGKSDDKGQAASAAPKSANELVGSFIDKAYADGKLSDTELAGLQALLKAGGLGGAESGQSATASGDKADKAASTDTQTAASTGKTYGYGDLARGNIDRDYELGLVNDDSYEKSMKYLSEV